MGRGRGMAGGSGRGGWGARLILAAGLIGAAIAPAWAQPGEPDVRGTYGGSGNVTLSSCTTALFNGQRGLTATIDIPEQVGQAFAGVMAGGVSGLPVAVSAQLVGTVAANGNLEGTFAFAIVVTGVAAGTGTGTFTGQAQGDSLALNLSGQVESAPPAPAANCQIVGSVTASRAPSSVTFLTTAVLPSSRSVQVGSTATAFASVLNVGQKEGLGCRIAPITAVPADFTFWTTDPATNEVTGGANVPADIPVNGAQTFVIAFTATGEFPPTEIQLSFDCLNAPPATVIPGVNTLLLSASSTPGPDIVALVATLGNNGIVDIPGTTGTGFFGVASVNLGASASITVTADTGGAVLPIEVSVCQSDPATAACTSDLGPSVVTQINAGTTPTFTVWVKGNGQVDLDPATKRIFVRFRTGDVTRGSTSVAVRTAP